MPDFHKFTFILLLSSKKEKRKQRGGHRNGPTRLLLYNYLDIKSAAFIYEGCEIHTMFKKNTYSHDFFWKFVEVVLL